MMLGRQIVACIADAIGEGPHALHAPTFSGNELSYLDDCVESTMVSSVGRYSTQFESELVRVTGAKHAVSVVNGTAALHLALLVAGVGTGDEVLVPALSFVATANAVVYCGAVPHFVDVNESTLGMDPDALRSWLERSTYSDAGCLYNSVTLRPIRAVVPMHTFGHPCDLNGILAVAREFDLIVVEDAAEALGSRYLDKHTGHYGLVGAFSFNGNKIVTTGGGGALVTDDPVLADRARHLATTARVPHEWAISHDEVGYNFRMPALNAALGCGQIERLPEMLKSKRRLYAAYQAAFEELDGVTVFGEPVNCRSNYWLQTVVLDPERAEDLQDVLRLTNEAGYQVRPAWTLLSEMAQFAKCPRAGLPVSESLAGRLLNLPSSAGLA